MLMLVKKNIHMNHLKGNVTTQITLDDDFIVPDTMDDMEQVVLENGEIQLESVKNMGEKVVIKGKLDFHVLYRKSEGGLQALGGVIPFEETVNVPDLEERDTVNVSWDLDDLNAGIINSRKLSMKAIVTLEVRVEELNDVEAAVDVVSDQGGTGQIQVESLKKKQEIAAISVHKKDTFRIKEGLQLPANKPNIDRILWTEMRLRGNSSRPMDGKIMLEGDLMLFIIYAGEGEGAPVQWLEERIPYAGEVELSEAKEDMIPAINARLVHREISEKPDLDGEMRELELDAVIELDIKLYEEESIEILSDLYSTNRELELQTGNAQFEQITAKNICKCKISEKIELADAERVLQICHSEGNVKIDEKTIMEDGLNIEGVLEIRLLYLTADDADPLRSVVENLPFHYVAEIGESGEDALCQLTAGLEQLTAVMMGGESVEIKAVVSLDILVLQPIQESVVTAVEETPLNMQKLQQLPGIVAYIVQPGDTLWNIAKKFHTTMDNVMFTNDLPDTTLHTSDRLLLVKEIAAN